MASKRAYLREVNPHLTCPLCRGYLIDATTVVECLHSFCRSCILKHLTKNGQCPSCKQLLNTAKPNIKADKTLQEIVYKLVPGLYHKEMKKRREFYSKHPEYGFAANLNHLGGADSATPEQRGEDVSGRLIFAPEDVISLSLEYLPPEVDPNNLPNDVKQHHQPDKDSNDPTRASRRYLNCPALVIIAYLKKFLALKYNIDVTRYNIDICHNKTALPEHWTLMDVAYIFAWKRNDPMRFFYRIMLEEQRLEAPSDVRPSTPGLGASQPPTSDAASESIEKINIRKSIERQLSPSKPFVALERSSIDMLAKRTSPTKSSTQASSKNESDTMKQVKTPIKIMKKPDGRYKVLSNTPEPTKTAEFSVVSIGDSANSNGVKITLKQCPPGSNSNNSSKKPKMISNVLLHKPLDEQELKKQEKHKRKQVNFEKKKSIENPDKKQFLQGFSLTSKHSQSKQTIVKDNSVEAQVKEIIKNKQLALQKANEEEAKKKQQPQPQQQQSEVKTSSTNIADRLNDTKQLVSGNKASSIQSTSEQQQPVDVYTFPGDPPAPIVPAGAVKRKCPPGLPIFEIRKKQQQYQTKKANISVAKNATVKCYKNQSAKQPLIYPKPPPSPARSIQSPSPNTPPLSASSPIVSSTSTKSASPLISEDTRTLLDGCGLNIPASLSITLTAPKSPSRSNDQSSAIRGAKDAVRHNPSITLNDKSVDPKVLKALKTGQMRVPSVGSTNSKAKKHQMQSHDQATPAKKKKLETQPPQLPSPLPPPQNISLDLSGNNKRMDIPLKIPIPIGKAKTKPPNWTQPICPKPSPKDEFPTFGTGPVVTLPGGQRVYRAPPGSLTPAAHRFNDMPSPSRAPVYAPCFSPGPSAQFASPFPTLKNLYLLNQGPSLDPFAMESRMRMASIASSPVKSISPSIPVNSAPVGKSHLAAQCAPIKPARSSVGSFAVPLAKQTANGSANIKSSLPSTNVDKDASPKVDTSSNSTDSKTVAEIEDKKPETLKEASTKLGTEQNEKSVTSNSEERNSQQGSASPRVTSTVSPSPPPVANETVPNSVEKSSTSDSIESEKDQSNSGSEVTSTDNKSPESPDSSSVVSENAGNLVDSTKSTVENNKSTSPQKSEETKPPVKTEIKEEMESGNKDEKNTEEFKKPMTPEVLQKRFLAAFPSEEWANNPVAAEQLGNLLKSLSSQAEAQSKNVTKPVEK